jgi:hypothetical protein
MDPASMAPEACSQKDDGMLAENGLFTSGSRPQSSSWNVWRIPIPISYRPI